MQFYTELDPGGLTILANLPSSTTQNQLWIGMWQKQDFLAQINYAIQIETWQLSTILRFFPWIPYSRESPFRGNPDFSGYSSWERIRDGK